MSDRPTTENGPLHTPEANLDHRLVRAVYDTADQAHAARQLLIQSGIAADRVDVINDAAENRGVDSLLKPDDKGIVARIRETIAPDDSKTAIIDAAKGHKAILELRPTREEVEPAVKIIERTQPSQFDADLERWRNAG